MTSTASGLIAQYIKDTLPKLVLEESKKIESNIKIPKDGIGITDITFNDDSLTIKLTNGQEFNKSLKFEEINTKVDSFLNTLKADLIDYSNTYLKGKDGVDGVNGINGTNGTNGLDGNSINDIKVDKNGRLIIYTTNKTYDLGVIKKKSSGFNSSGGGGGGSDFTYSNSLPMPNDVGGLPAGTTFDKMQLTELFNKLLYSYSTPAFSYFIIQEASQIYEIGNSINAGEAQTEWTIANAQLLQPNSISITYLNTGDIIGANLPNISPTNLLYPAINSNVPVDCIFQIKAFDTNGASFTRDFVIRFLDRIFVGESDLEDLTEGQVENLRVSQLKSNINGTYPMLDGVAGDYKWFCFPVEFGQRTEFFDLNTGFEVVMDDPVIKNIVNQYGVAKDYYCYRTFNALQAAITIDVRG